MVGSIIGGAGQKTPASTAFQAGQAPKNPNNTQKLQDAPQAKNLQDARLSAGKEEEINQLLALSRDNTRPNPSQVFNNSQERGSILDIKV